MPRLLKVNEVYGPVMQGEGVVIGQKTIFVRFTLCDARCTWCDTMYAVDPKHKDFESHDMTEERIVDECEKLNCKNVTFSGGNPAIYDLDRLIDMLHERGYWINMETQGSVSKPYFSKLDLVTLSPKPPSSGETTNWPKLDGCIALAKRYHLKVVVNPDFEGDYEYAKQVYKKYTPSDFTLQVCSPDDANANVIMERYRKLASMVAQDREYSHQVRVLLQLHSLVYGRVRKV